MKIITAMKHRMKQIFVTVFIIANLCSCKSNKDLIYFQNLSAGNVQFGVPFSTTDYQLRKDDNLYIQVRSINPEVNQLFNPSEGTANTSGTTQQYGTLSAQYINGYQIDQDGNVDLPIIGKINVLGKTISEAKELLVKNVNEYFKEAIVSVKLLSFKYTVMGEVTSPGVYYNYNNACTILEAISQANGTTDYAGLKNVTVLRENKDGKKSIKVDLSDQTLLSSEAYYLQPNDVIYVAPDKYKNTRLNSSLYALTLSSISTLIVILKYLGE